MPAERTSMRFREPAIAALLAIAGCIHLLPLPGVLGGAWLSRLYGVAPDDAGLLLLLSHRAVLFGLLGALLVASAWRASLRSLAIGAGMVSTLAFLLLAGDPRALSPAILRVWIVDIVAVACLLLAWVLARRATPTRGP